MLSFSEALTLLSKAGIHPPFENEADKDFLSASETTYILLCRITYFLTNVPHTSITLNTVWDKAQTIMERATSLQSHMEYIKGDALEHIIRASLKLFFTFKEANVRLSSFREKAEQYNSSKDSSMLKNLQKSLFCFSGMALFLVTLAQMHFGEELTPSQSEKLFDYLSTTDILTMDSNVKKYAIKLVLNEDDTDWKSCFAKKRKSQPKSDLLTIVYQDRLNFKKYLKNYIDYCMAEYTSRYKDPESSSVVEANSIDEVNDDSSDEAVESETDETLVEATTTTKPDFHRYYSPSFVVCQSSGFGKSKSFVELADKFTIFYICLRPDGTNGLPDRSPIVADMLSNFTSEKQFCSFLAACIRAAPRSSADPKQFLRTQIEKEDYSTAFWKSIKQDMSLQNNIVRAKQTLYWSFNDYKSECEKNNVPVRSILFVFDEVRRLLPSKGSAIKDKRLAPYFLLRSALNGFKEGVFALFADTMSSLANFAPSKYYDPSEKIFKHGSLLFDPLIFYPVGTVRCKNIDFFRSRFYGNDALEFNPLQFAEMSRPMFAVYLTTEIEEGGQHLVAEAWKSLISFARDKFLGDWNLNIDCIEKSSEVTDFALAVLCARFPLIPASFTRSEDLVGSHLAALTYVSPGREKILCKYVNEPVVGEAVAQIVHHNWNFYSLLFKKLVELRTNGDIGALHAQGDVGEFVAMAILMYSLDCALRRFNYSKSSLGQVFGSPVPMNDFLSQLLPNFKANVLFKDAFISFLQFGKMKSRLFAEMLKDSFERRLALALKDHAFALDLVIPIKRVDSMSAIFVQVKNHADNSFNDADVDLIFANMSHQEVQLKLKHGLQLLLIVGPSKWRRQLKDVPSGVFGEDPKTGSIRAYLHIAEMKVFDRKQKNHCEFPAILKDLSSSLEYGPMLKTFLKGAGYAEFAAFACSIDPILSAFEKSEANRYILSKAPNSD